MNNVSCLFLHVVVVLCVDHRGQRYPRVIVQRCCIAVASWSYWSRRTLCPCMCRACTTSKMHKIAIDLCHVTLLMINALQTQTFYFISVDMVVYNLQNVRSCSGSVVGDVPSRLIFAYDIKSIWWKFPQQVHLFEIWKNSFFK